VLRSHTSVEGGKNKRKERKKEVSSSVGFVYGNNQKKM
jgi:hypothetical protein